MTMTMKQIVTEYNNMAETFGFKSVKKFSTIAKGLERLRTRQDEFVNKEDLSKGLTKNDLTPRSKEVAVQDPKTPVTRREAYESNFTLYWNGAPCSNGHISPRYTKSGRCKKCYQLFRANELKFTDTCVEKLK